MRMLPPQLWPVIVNLIIKPFSFLLVLFAYALILAVVFFMMRYIIPRAAPWHEAPLLRMSLLSIALFFLVNIFFNYTACTFTDPGSPPKSTESPEILGEEIIMVGGKPHRRYTHRLEVVPGASYRYCRVCKTIKPPRAHHCSISGRCILDYDHYCPW